MSAVADEDGTNGEPDDGGSGSMFGDAKPVISPTHAERAAHHGAPRRLAARNTSRNPGAPRCDT